MFHNEQNTPEILMYAMNAYPSHSHGFPEWRVMNFSRFPLSPSAVLLIFEQTPLGGAPIINNFKIAI